MKSTLTTFFAILLILNFELSFSQERIAYHADGEQVFQTSLDRVLIHFKHKANSGKRNSIINTAKYKRYFETKDLSFDQDEAVLATKSKLKNTDSLNILFRMFESDSSVVSANPVLIYRDGTLQGISDRILIRLKAGSGLAILKEALKKYKYEKIEKNAFIDREYTVFLSSANKKDALDIANELYLSKKFEYAEVDYVRLLCPQTADPFFDNQWAIKNTGQSGGTSCADMRVEAVWTTSTGSNIKVAIIDEGVDLTHPDLQGNLLSGYDATGGGSGGGAAGNDAHGTACAGIVAAIANNNIGTAGVAYDARIIPVRIAYGVVVNGVRQWQTNDSWLSNGISWAYQNGADVLSNSWGGGSSSASVNAAISNAVTYGRSGKGSVVLFSSGNNNSSVSYPATNSNVVAVGATSMCDTRKRSSSNSLLLSSGVSPDPQGVSCDGENWWGSNYGNELDIVAPGVQIYTADIQGVAGYNQGSGTSGDYVSNFNGTSAACPNAAGVMALILSANPGLTQLQARTIILSTADKLPGYSGFDVQVGFGRVNALRAVLEARSVQLSGPDFFCTNGTYSLSNVPAGYTVTWSATGNTFFSGPNTGNSVTINNSGNEQIFLTATIGSGCGINIVNKRINVGTPFYPSGEMMVSGDANATTSGMYSYNMPAYPNAVSYDWDVWGGTGSPATVFENGTNSCNVIFNSPGYYGVLAQVTTSCDTSTWLDPQQLDVYVTNGFLMSSPYNVYPNPADNILNVNFKASPSVSSGLLFSGNKPLRIELFNSEGKNLSAQSNTRQDGPAVSINTTAIPNGKYFLHITEGKETIRKQVIIQH